MSAKTTILFIAPFPTHRFKGGINYIAEVIRENQQYFTDKNVEIEFFNSEFSNRTDKTVRKIKLVNIIYTIRLFFKILYTTRKTKPDVIYLNTSAHLGLLKDITILKFIRPFQKGRIMIHIHFAEFQKVFLKNRWIRRFILNVLRTKIDGIIVLSKGFKKELVNNNISDNKISLLYNFHNYDINKITENTRQKLGMIFLGSIDKRKGIIDLLDVVKTIDAKNIHLDICGTVKDFSISNEFNLKLNELGNKVTFHGYTSGEKKETLLLKSDILVLPSYAEGLPIVILEGFATGNAIIASSVGAIPEIVHPENGWLFKPGDKVRLTEIIKKNIIERETLSVIKQGNLQISKQYTKEIFFSKLLSIFRDQ